jgi:hypothetical protein
MSNVIEDTEDFLFLGLIGAVVAGGIYLYFKSRNIESGPAAPWFPALPDLSKDGAGNPSVWGNNKTMNAMDQLAAINPFAKAVFSVRDWVVNTVTGANKVTGGADDSSSPNVPDPGVAQFISDIRSGALLGNGTNPIDYDDGEPWSPSAGQGEGYNPTGV